MLPPPCCQLRRESRCTLLVRRCQPSPSACQTCFQNSSCIRGRRCWQNLKNSNRSIRAAAHEWCDAKVSASVAWRRRRRCKWVNQHCMRSNVFSSCSSLLSMCCTCKALPPLVLNLFCFGPFPTPTWNALRLPDIRIPHHGIQGTYLHSATFYRFIYIYIPLFLVFFFWRSVFHLSVHRFTSNVLCSALQSTATAKRQRNTACPCYPNYI